MFHMFHDAYDMFHNPTHHKKSGDRCSPGLCWCPLNRCTDFALKKSNINGYPHYRLSTCDTHYLIHGYLRQLNYNLSTISLERIVERYYGCNSDNLYTFSFAFSPSLQSSRLKALLLGLFDINCNVDYIFANCNRLKSNFLFNVDLNRLIMPPDGFLFEIGLFIVPKSAKKTCVDNGHIHYKSTNNFNNAGNSIVKLIQEKIDNNYIADSGRLFVKNFYPFLSDSSFSIIKNLNLWSGSTSAVKNDKNTNSEYKCADDNKCHENDSKYNLDHDYQYHGCVLDYRRIPERHYYQMIKSQQTPSGKPVVKELETKLMTPGELASMWKLSRYKYWKNYAFPDMLQGSRCDRWNTSSIGVGIIQNQSEQHVSIIYVKNKSKWKRKDKELILMNKINVKSDEVNNYYFFPVFAIYAPFTARYYTNIYNQPRKQSQFSVQLQNICLENVDLAYSKRYRSPGKLVTIEIILFCLQFCVDCISCFCFVCWMTAMFWASVISLALILLLSPLWTMPVLTIFVFFRLCRSFFFH